MKIYIGIEVPDDWEDRMDMQQTVEREVKADRWSWHRAIPAAPVAQPEPPAIWYMRDNHTFRRLSENVEQALIELEQEFNEGNTCGMLCSDREGFQSVHAGDNVTRLKFFAAAREELVKHIGGKA